METTVQHTLPFGHQTFLILVEAEIPRQKMIYNATALLASSCKKRDPGVIHFYQKTDTTAKTQTTVSNYRTEFLSIHGAYLIKNEEQTDSRSVMNTLMTRYSIIHLAWICKMTS
jgi:hypothetical protein